MRLSRVAICLLVPGTYAGLTKMGQYYANKFGWSSDVKELISENATPNHSYEGYSAEQLDNFVLNGYKLLFQELRPERQQKRFSSADAQRKRLIYSGSGSHASRVHWHWVPLIDRFEGNVPVIHKTAWTHGDHVTETPDLLRLDKFRTRRGGVIDETYDFPRAVVRYNNRARGFAVDQFTDVYTFPTSFLVVQDQVFKQGIPNALVELDIKRKMDDWLHMSQGDSSLHQDLQAYWRPFKLQHMLQSGPTGRSHVQARDQLEREVAGFLAKLKTSPRYFASPDAA